MPLALSLLKRDTSCPIEIIGAEPRSQPSASRWASREGSGLGFRRTGTTAECLVRHQVPGLSGLGGEASRQELAIVPFAGRWSRTPVERQLEPGSDVLSSCHSSFVSLSPRPSFWAPSRRVEPVRHVANFFHVIRYHRRLPSKWGGRVGQRRVAGQPRRLLGERWVWNPTDRSKESLAKATIPTLEACQGTG